MIREKGKKEEGKNSGGELEKIDLGAAGRGKSLKE